MAISVKTSLQRYNKVPADGENNTHTHTHFESFHFAFLYMYLGAHIVQLVFTFNFFANGRRMVFASVFVKHEEMDNKLFYQTTLN